MINSLSEQVADLEAKQHHLWDVKEAIRVENFELWSKNERLEAERDDLQRQVQEARDEIAELRAGQGRWPKEHLQPIVDQLRESIAHFVEDTAKTEPEPVTAETIRQSEPGSTWERDHHEAGGVYEWTGKKLWWHFVPHDDSGDYIDDVDQGGDWSRSTAAPRGDYDTPPRLTVHKLNVAPVGSWISRGMGSNGRRKRDDGLWEKAWLFEGQYPETSEELIANGWADATLTLPEDQS